jgi:hypothetical protein
MQNHRHKMLAIGTMPDLVHILTGYNVNQLIPYLVEEIKTSSNSFIKGKRLSKYKSEWQKGYGAFTHSHSQIVLVAEYILSQEEHHKKRPFNEEYFEILEKNDVQLLMNMSLNSLMTFIVGIKYYGALHLWWYITNALLQISGGSAAFSYTNVYFKYLTVPMIKGFVYKQLKTYKEINKRCKVQSTIKICR